MAIDPTKWPTPMHAWKFWVAEAEKAEKAVSEIRMAYEREHGRGPDTDRMISDDKGYQDEIGNQQFAASQAQLYAGAVQIRLLEAILAAVSKPDAYRYQVSQE